VLGNSRVTRSMRLALALRCPSPDLETASTRIHLAKSDSNRHNSHTALPRDTRLLPILGSGLGKASTRVTSFTLLTRFGLATWTIYRIGNARFARILQQNSTYHIFMLLDSSPSHLNQQQATKPSRAPLPLISSTIISATL
jgi:hypothetical protein